MSDERDPTHPLEEHPQAPRTGPGRSGPDIPDPVETFRQPDNRIKLLLFIAAVAVLNLLLLLAVVVEVRSDRADEVMDVEGDRCLLVEEEEANALYCRR